MSNTITNTAGIIDAAKKLSAGGRRRQVAVAGAQDADVLGAVRSAYDDGICGAVLFGDENKIQELAEKHQVALGGLEIVHQADTHQAILQAVECAASGKADVIMKGFVPTSDILKAVLHKRFNLVASSVMSHVAVLEVPGHHKLMLITDGGMIVWPSVEQKIEILKNAVTVGRALGIKPVRVALSAAAEEVLDVMPQTGECAQILKRLQHEKIDDCIVGGPYSFDVAFSKEIAKGVGVEHEVAGNADVYLVGSIEEGNITAKSMIVFGGAIFSGVIVGAKVPISLVSRTDPVLGKKASIALACLISEFLRNQGKVG